MEMMLSDLGPQVGGKTIAILGLHKVGAPPADGWDTWYHIPEETFVGHLNHLKQNDWQVIDVPTLLRGVASPAKLPERSALITFDDGYRSNREVALPLLRRFGYPAVIFVAVDYIGKTNIFDIDEEPEEWMCDWDDLRELERCGVSVQSHSVTHRAFSELSSAMQEEELRRSKAILEAGLGRPVELFSYPYGDEGGNPAKVAEALRRTGYRAACLYSGGLNVTPILEPYRLNRLTMGSDTDLGKELERVLSKSVTSKPCTGETA